MPGSENNGINYTRERYGHQSKMSWKQGANGEKYERDPLPKSPVPDKPSGLPAKPYYSSFSPPKFLWGTEFRSRKAVKVYLTRRSAPYCIGVPSDDPVRRAPEMAAVILARRVQILSDRRSDARYPDEAGSLFFRPHLQWGTENASISLGIRVEKEMQVFAQDLGRTRSAVT